MSSVIVPAARTRPRRSAASDRSRSRSSPCGGVSGSFPGMSLDRPERALRDAAYGIFLVVAVGVPLSGPIIYWTMGEAGMMVAIIVLVAALPVAVAGVAFSLVCWREWPLLALSALAVASTVGLARGLAAYEPVGAAFVVASVGFGGWWFGWRRRRAAAPRRRR